MIGTASLEQWERDSQYVTQLRAENAELKRQRDELLAALEKLVEVYDAMGAPRGPSRIIAEAAMNNRKEPNEI